MILPQLNNKPTDSRWTDDQWTAIQADGANILVAAAAGSGKTAVLVERIIRKIASEIDVDRLLVATFTKAAAAEMKERISKALELRLAQNPSSAHLRKQLALMNRASITTLHSFCLEVIRRYYPLIQLDPGFRVANETESELLRLEVLDDLFEEKYQAAESEGLFLQLVDYFGGEDGDEELYKLVQQIFQFSQSHPWPDYWLMETASSFVIANAEMLEQSDWLLQLKAAVQLAIEGASALLAQALAVASENGGPEEYAQMLLVEYNAVQELAHTCMDWSWDELSAAVFRIQFGRLKPVKGEHVDAELKEQCKQLRDAAKDQISKIKSEWFGRSLADYAAELNELSPYMRGLSLLVTEFGSKYELAKRKKGLLDYGDLEHYCLRILRAPGSTPEHTEPSAAASEYRQQFEEILLDEYQDTNMVQEAIVELISRPGSGNRFMVGDVKQSIYRFRLAEPKLFLHKYKSYQTYRQEENLVAAGTKIDLARNFRSRREVIEGANFIFRSIMRENVAEMNYDKQAELVCGAAFNESVGQNYAIESIIIEKQAKEQEAGNDRLFGAEESDEDTGITQAERESAEELHTAQLEARAVAAKLTELTQSGFSVQSSEGKQKPFQWRDCVILLRSASLWAPVFIDELRAQGIPAYAELSSGYFDAVEVETMLSLLAVIDNPYQDIPLAAVLKSPIFGLTAEQLAQIRIVNKNGAYYDAVLEMAGMLGKTDQLGLKLALFLDRLDRWREEARQGALADLIWLIYRETGYFDFVSGLPGGVQRQANLRALHDRARQYEATSLRGLFRFLRFIQRMRESGGDLGTASALGEGENVVRIMTIHKSKGLEFPIVFVCGTGKQFNQQDLRGSFFLHKTLGFGPRVVDQQLRISYPSLPSIAIKAAQQMELLAEEMRVLYVALTRPKEKLYLMGTVNNGEKKLLEWQRGMLTDYRIASARSFLDWLGPLIANSLSDQVHAGLQWTGSIVHSSLFVQEAATAQEPEQESGEREDRLLAVQNLALLDIANNSELETELNWQYRYEAASRIAAKTSVSEMKRQYEEEEEAASFDSFSEAVYSKNKAINTEDDNQPEDGPAYTLHLTRPLFMEEKKMTPAERGSAYHAFMQHLTFHNGLSPDPQLVLNDMLDKRLLTPAQAEAIQLASIQQFLNSELAIRMAAANWLYKEVPFSCMLPVARVYPAQEFANLNEQIMIQGIIDCLFEDGQGIVLVDYKTDRIWNRQWQQAAERHRFQIELYAEAIEKVLKKPILQRFVFFFDGAKAILLD